MRTVAVDTLYWIALINPRDEWHEPAKHARESVGEARLLTTDEVLSEFLTAVGRGGPMIRAKAAETVEQILQNPNVTVVEQSRESFTRARQFYRSRPDKAYSMVDCSLMAAMQVHSVNDVLTHDRHFSQEGFTVLIQRQSGTAQ